MFIFLLLCGLYNVVCTLAVRLCVCVCDYTHTNNNVIRIAARLAAIAVAAFVVGIFGLQSSFDCFAQCVCHCACECLCVCVSSLPLYVCVSPLFLYVCAAIATFIINSSVFRSVVCIQMNALH